MFLILSLPRSRSAWMTHFLNYPLARPPVTVGHDILIECDDVAQFIDSYRNGMTGTVETSAAPLWKIVRKELPDCKIVVVRRPLIEVYRSLEKHGYLFNLSELAELNELLEMISEMPRVCSICYEGLDSPGVCKWLFEYCLEIDFDFDWWLQLQGMNIQVDLKERMEQLERRKESMERVRQEVLEKSRGIECLN